MDLCETLCGVAAEAAVDALEKVRLGQLRSVGEAESYIEGKMGSIIDALLPTAKEELATLLTPAAQQTVEAIKPALYETLRDWMPSFAAISGGMIALSVLLGVYVAKRVFHGGRR